MKLGFLIEEFNIRGSGIAQYDYAHYNEIILKNRISDKKVSFLIDGNTFPVSIQMNNNITIPISNEKESQTSRLVYNHLNCLFDIEEDSDSIQFVFREERKWKND